MTHASQTLDASILADTFRQAMRRLATTVTIITSRDERGRHGMTATSVTSLTMSPPALLVCINRSASIYDVVQSTGTFCVNLLAGQHEELCVAFGGRLKSEERFHLGDWREGEEQLPYLANAQAAAFCQHDGALDYGTHTIVIGRVFAVRVNEDVGPLIYQDGSLGHWRPLATV